MRYIPEIMSESKPRELGYFKTSSHAMKYINDYLTIKGHTNIVILPANTYIPGKLEFSAYSNGQWVADFRIRKDENK